MSDDLREAWEERAAILEYDAGIPRRIAERFAARGLGIPWRTIMEWHAEGVVHNDDTDTLPSQNGSSQT